MNLDRILPILIGTGLLAAGGLSYAGPETKPEPDSKQVWGDPEEDDRHEEGWTWFGMGYESRNRTWDPVNDPPGNSLDSSPGGKGKDRR